MPKNRTANQDPTKLETDIELHQRLLAMPATGSVAKRTEPGFFTFMAAWSERRFAAECCRELLKLHQVVSASHSDLAGVALYRLVVAAHVGSDLTVAESLLQRAQESYALWPVQRALTFRDVAHYLAVSGYWALHRGRRWICSDIRRVIDSSIPKHL